MSAPSVETSFRAESLQRLHVSVWSAAPTGDDVARLESEVEAIVSRYGSASILLVVEPTSPVAGEEARTRAVKMLRKLGTNVDSVALVVEGTGFWAAAVRSMFSGLALILRPSFEWRLFATVEPATLWQGRYLAHASSTVGRVEVLAAVDRLRNPTPPSSRTRTPAPSDLAAKRRRAS